jgi:putative acetyltransferase
VRSNTLDTAAGHAGLGCSEVPAIIVAERPDSTDARALISELEAHLAPLYPAESRHGFSIEQLLQEKVAFFVIRYDGLAAGCGGVKLFGTEYGEIKRMYVRLPFRGLGLAKLMLDHLAGYARKHGAGLLRLETGIYQYEAIGLYEQMGFRQIPPFGAYREDPLSRFYEKKIS